MIRFGQKDAGFTVIGVLMTILGLGFLGHFATQSGATDSASTGLNKESFEAFYIGQAGLEFAKRELDYGNDPHGVVKDLGFGSFEIESDPATDRITVTAVSGQAQKIQSINVTFSEDIHSLNSGSAVTGGTSIQNISLVKAGHSQSVVSQIKLDWNWGACEGDGGSGDGEGGEDGDNDCEIDYSQYEDLDHPGKILVCHLPNGDPDKANTISVGLDQWEGENGHSSHEGDYLGECGEGGSAGESGGDGGEECGNEGGGGEGENYACPEDEHDHGGAYITSMTLDGTTIFSGGNAASGAANQIIDVSDFILTADGSYDFDVNFNETLPADAWYEVTIIFADGTEVSTPLVF